MMINDQRKNRSRIMVPMLLPDAAIAQGDSLPLPHNLEAERSILGAILLDNSALAAARQIVTPSDFFLVQNQKIFARMLLLSESSTPIDTVILLDEFTKTSDLTDGLAAYLSALPDGLPRSSHVEHYAFIVRENSVLRSMAHAGQLIQEQALAHGANP
jgi:replicative DNA helicase